MFKSFSFLVALLSLLIVSCSGYNNYKKAYGFQKDGKTFIKLKGKRYLAGHNLSPVFSNKTYEDSLVIQVSSLHNIKISGKDIPARPGYYKYLGNVTIQDDKVKVNLSYDNTDDKKIDPISWNGEYDLVRDWLPAAHNTGF